MYKLNLAAIVLGETPISNEQGKSHTNCTVNLPYNKNTTDKISYKNVKTSENKIGKTLIQQDQNAYNEDIIEPNITRVTLDSTDFDSIGWQTATRRKRGKRTTQKDIQRNENNSLIQNGKQENFKSSKQIGNLASDFPRQQDLKNAPGGKTPCSFQSKVKRVNQTSVTYENAQTCSLNTNINRHYIFSKYGKNSAKRNEIISTDINETSIPMTIEGKWKIFKDLALCTELLSVKHTDPENYSVQSEVVISKESHHTTKALEDESKTHGKYRSDNEFRESELTQNVRYENLNSEHFISEKATNESFKRNLREINEAESSESVKMESGSNPSNDGESLRKQTLEKEMVMNTNILRDVTIDEISECAQYEYSTAAAENYDFKMSSKDQGLHNEIYELEVTQEDDDTNFHTESSIFENVEEEICIGILSVKEAGSNEFLEIEQSSNIYNDIVETIKNMSEFLLQNKIISTDKLNIGVNDAEILQKLISRDDLNFSANGAEEEHQQKYPSTTTAENHENQDYATPFYGCHCVIPPSLITDLIHRTTSMIELFSRSFPEVQFYNEVPSIYPNRLSHSTSYVQMQSGEENFSSTSNFQNW